MKKIIAVSILVCLTITLVFSTALAQEEPAFVSPVDGTYFEVSQGQEVVLWDGWVACTKGLTTAFLTSVHLYWELDGEPLFTSDEEVAERWHPIQPWDLSSECIAAHEGQSWFAFWGYPLGSFDEVGTHTVKLEVWFDHPVTDGFDLDGDKRPDIYSGSTGLLSATIEVVEGP